MDATHVVSACGMATSLGDSVHGCAAFRAGIVRPSPITDVEVLDAHSQSPVPVTGHQVSWLTDGHPISMRWVRLAVAAIQDLLTQPGVPAVEQRSFWQRCGVRLILPTLRHPRFQTEDSDGCEDEIRHAVVRTILDQTKLTIDPAAIMLCDRGPAGTAYAVQDLTKRMEAGEIDRGLIVAVDSLLDHLTLEWLAASDRLKRDDQPCGLVPGEAGVCLVLERDAEANARGVRARARIVGRATSLEGAEQALPEHAGRTLARLYVQSLDMIKQPSVTAVVVSDLNGETRRSEAFAFALHFIGQHRLTNSAVVIPASGFGDTGAASGALGICVAVHAFSRQSRGPDTAVVFSQEECGEVGIVMLGKLESRAHV